MEPTSRIAFRRGDLDVTQAAKRLYDSLRAGAGDEAVAVHGDLQQFMLHVAALSRALQEAQKLATAISAMLPTG